MELSRQKCLLVLRDESPNRRSTASIARQMSVICSIASIAQLVSVMRNVAHT